MFSRVLGLILLTCIWCCAAWGQLTDQTQAPNTAKVGIAKSLPDEVGAAVREDRSRSFHAEPLSIGTQLVGILVLASQQPGAIPREARRVAARADRSRHAGSASAPLRLLRR